MFSFEYHEVALVVQYVSVILIANLKVQSLWSARGRTRYVAVGIMIPALHYSSLIFDVPSSFPLHISITKSRGEWYQETRESLRGR